MVNNKLSMVNSEPPAHFEALYPDTSRFVEIEKILKHIREGRSVQLVGLPGVGRSNLFGLLSFNKNVRKKHLGENQKWFHFVPVNFSEIRNRPPKDATRFIFLSLVESLRERQTHKTKESSFAAEGSFEAIQSIFKESTETNDEMVQFQGLKRAIDYLCIEKEITVVFLFDRFEEYASIVTPEFFSHLKTLRNRAKYRFSVIFSLPRPLEDLIDPAVFADFHESLADNIVYLSLFDKDGLTFRISYLEKVSAHKFDPKLIEQVIKLTGGHGKLTRLALEALKETQENLEKYLLDQKSIQGSLFEIWQALIPSEQESIISRADYSDFLVNAELIRDSKLTIPLLYQFIPFLQNEDKKITFNNASNEILLGSSAISELLTSSEHRLLKFLIENEGKIIERDELIMAVWKDSGTLGVSDQALDQLLFRIRKKIEKNPESPTHLQTLKGKGIRFIS